MIKEFVPRFIPDEYCDFPHLRRTAYLGMFPGIADDEEVGSLLSEVVATSKSKLADEQKRAREKLVPPPSIGSRPSEAYQKPYKPETAKTQFLEREIQDAVLAQAAIHGGSLDPITSLILPVQEIMEGKEGRTKNVGLEGRYNAPLRLLDLALSRWIQVQKALRGHMFDRSLQVFFVSLDGISPFPNSNVWLDDEFAQSVLKSGEAAPDPLRFPGAKYELLFLGSEVAKLFPPLSVQKANPKARPGRPGKVDSVITFLRQTYPEGRPAAKSIEQLRREAENAQGESISETTIKRAIKGAWGPKLS